MNKALIIFIKNIENNNVKTRLAATVGHTLAQKVYRELLARTHSAVKGTNTDITVYYSREVLPEDEWSLEGYNQDVQATGDLGEKMKDAFARQFADGKEKVVIIGSDCPDLSTELINQAFEQLDRNDVVFGPSEDGGYYLLGMTSLIPMLFENKEWSTDTVLKSSLDDLDKVGKHVALLPELNDIDTEEDLKSSSLSHLLDQS
ncbi:MAG: TIGR04282 family arsenosugar biosynthesis glycosyltransferase [Cyclobacteriaceae bacterium]